MEAITSLLDRMWLCIFDYFKNNPFSAAWNLTSTLLFVYPNFLVAALGFGPLGPVAGWLAPFVQSRIGTVWLFRVFQSAGMGGGAAVGLFRGIRGSVALGNALKMVGASCSGNNATASGL